jgi:hypothetical protein
MNQLNVSLQHSITTLAAHGWSHRRIARELDIHRETVGRHLRLAGSKPAKVLTGSAPDPAAKPAIPLTGCLVVSSSESKPARGERIKTGHSEVRDSYHFWFFNQEIFFLR